MKFAAEVAPNQGWCASPHKLSFEVRKESLLRFDPMALGTVAIQLAPGPLIVDCADIIYVEAMNAAS
jgi:hypothetical protein